ncbi:MAG: kelch repeat-containing protein [Smithellaceae bacterium]|nr:kelch repeat-containing protein [Smithellaceae bacterium]
MRKIFATLAILSLLAITACGSSTSDEGSTSTHGISGGDCGSSAKQSVLVSGSDIVDQPGIYGTQGVAATTNAPGGRDGSVSWIDGSGNLWLFGGLGGYDASGTGQLINDLWKFDGTNWTWISGSNAFNQSGIYGTKGSAGASNIPGARWGAVSWIDSSGNLWLFGGQGYDASGSGGYLNDLWKFDGTNWTWVSGSSAIGQTGVYGTQGLASPANVPGARGGSVSWIDGSGNLWLFGGWYYDASGSQRRLNDLWKFDGTNWTWVSGSSATNQAGNYGTKGTAAASNIPGTRGACVSWIDGSGNLWLFGGYGNDSAGSSGWLNDLWEFDGTNWTWVNGANTINQTGIYGTKGGVPVASNVPGARQFPVSWIDGTGNLWLFGGYGYDSTGALGYLDDLWKFDGANWTWVSGCNTINNDGNYGTKGVAAATNAPGGRQFLVSWADSAGKLWLFGGQGYDSAGSLGLLNDLWYYEP